MSDDKYELKVGDKVTLTPHGISILKTYGLVEKYIDIELVVTKTSRGRLAVYRNSEDYLDVDDEMFELDLGLEYEYI